MDQASSCCDNTQTHIETFDLNHKEGKGLHAYTYVHGGLVFMGQCPQDYEGRQVLSCCKNEVGDFPSLPIGISAAGAHKGPIPNRKADPLPSEIKLLQQQRQQQQRTIKEIGQ